VLVALANAPCGTGYCIGELLRAVLDDIAEAQN
jgi:hypothetical protein